MAVLERSELEASPLADLHTIADQLGLDGFRRLRKAALIDTILGEESADSDDRGDGNGNGKRERAAVSEKEPEAEEGEKSERSSSSRTRSRGGRAKTGRSRRSTSSSPAQDDSSDEEKPSPKRERAASRDSSSEEPAAIAEGVVELLGNGSAFLRISPPEPSDADVYISAAQVRRCELVSGDRVSGPVRTPRRSERYPSLVRIDTINGASADSVSDGARYDDLPVEYPSTHLTFGSDDATLQAIEWLTPLGRGSRALIVGPSRSGKTETLRRLLAAVSGRDDLDVTVVLAGSRPEEIADWQQASPAPVAALSFAASADSQSQAVERAMDAAKRVAARGGDALVLIDGLDGLQPHAARKALAGARNLREGGSLTVIATAVRPFGGESTVIALDLALTSTGRQPIIDLVNSGTLKPELLVGEDGARAITQARATALDAGS
jgi:transcription termination factor Rho